MFAYDWIFAKKAIYLHIKIAYLGTYLVAGSSSADNCT